MSTGMLIPPSIRGMLVKSGLKCLFSPPLLESPRNLTDLAGRGWRGEE